MAPPSLPVDVWVTILGMVRRGAARRVFRALVTGFRYRCVRAAHFGELWRRIKGRVGSRRALAMCAFAGVRAEWLRCPLDWMSMLGSESSSETLRSIEREAEAGHWGAMCEAGW